MAQSFWPGQRSRTNVQPDTTSDDLWREIGRLAETASDFNTQIYTRQAQDQLSTSGIQVEAAEAELTEAIAAEQDESKFEAILKAHNAKINKFKPKNPLAAKGFDLLIAERRISWDKAHKEAIKDRLKEKWETKADIYEKRAIETGNFALYEKHMMGGFLHGQDTSKINKRIETARHLADRRKMESMAGNNPEWILENMETPADMKRLFPNSIPSDFAYITGITKGAISERKLARGRITLKQTASIKEAATDPEITADFMGRKISQSDGLTPEQKITALNLYTQSRRAMANGRSNAYTTTENEELYTNHRRRAANRTITEQEIIDSVGPGGYSWPRAEKLVSIINGSSSSSKAFEESAAAKNLTQQIKVMIPVTGDLADRESVALNQFANQRGLGLLEDAMLNHPEWTDRENKEEALRIGRHLEREYEDGTLELGIERALEMTTVQRAFKTMPLAPGKLKGKKDPTRNEFTKHIAALKRQGKTKEAREYYDKWVGKLWQ